MNLSAIKAFAKSIAALVKAHPVLFFLFLFVIVLFVAAPFYMVWTKGVKPLLSKVSPSLAENLDKRSSAPEA